MPFYTFMVRERSFSGEQQPPRIVRAHPPPPQRRTAREVEEWISLFKHAYACPEPSIFSNVQAMPKWIRFIPLPRLPSSLEWRLFTAFLKAGSGSLSYTRACEIAALDRGDSAVREAWEKLFAELKVTYVRSSDKHGKPTAWSPSKLGQTLLSPSFVFIGGEEAQEIAAQAWRHYISEGCFCCTAAQSPGVEAPDLVAYDYRRLKAIAVEVESSSECRSHREQVHRNMLKWRELGFNECHVWFPKIFEKEVREILELLPEDARLNVKIFPV